MQEFVTSCISDLENNPLSHAGLLFIDIFQCTFITLYLLISLLKKQKQNQTNKQKNFSNRKMSSSYWQIYIFQNSNF